LLFGAFDQLVKLFVEFAGGASCVFRFSHFGDPFAFGLGGTPFLFWRNAKPINPSTSKITPAPINQCGYAISENVTYFSFFGVPQFRLQPHLDEGATSFSS
jgi:hypothetical protein